MEEEKLVKLKCINDPEQLKEILLKKYTNDEVNYYYKDNLHYSLEYSYYCEKSGGEGGGLLKELEDAITDYFSVKHHVMDLMKEESSHYKDYEDDLPRVINYIDYLDALLAIFMINVSGKPLTQELYEKCIMRDNMDQLIKDVNSEECNPNEDGKENDESEINKGLKACINKIEHIVYDFYKCHIGPILTQMINFEVEINCSAVECILRCFRKTLRNVDISVDFLKAEDSEVNRKNFLAQCCYLSRYISIFFTASIDDQDAMFFTKELNSDIELMSNNIQIIDFENQWDDLNNHFQLYFKGVQAYKNGYAIGSRCLKHDSGFVQTLNFIGWKSIYWWKNKKAEVDGKLFEVLMNQPTMQKIVRLRQKYYLSDEIDDIPGTIEVNSLIYIPMTHEDELKLDNLDDTSVPQMVTKNFDLHFNNDLSKFDREKFIKFRVVSNKDWGRVDWKNGKLIDENADPVEVDTVIFDIHGGSFNVGSSGDQLKFTKDFTMKTNYPVFSMDYRLAPDYKFPKGLSDCFQVYLWLVYYAEVYLQLKFKNVIITGDSAGGNLSIGVTALSIMRNLKIPSGLSLFSPAACLDRLKFFPSLANSLDDL